MDDDFTDKIIQNIGIYYAKSGDAEASEKHEQLGERLDFLQEYVAKAEKQVSREQFVRIFNVFVKRSEPEHVIRRLPNAERPEKVELVVKMPNTDSIKEVDLKIIGAVRC